MQKDPLPRRFKTKAAATYCGVAEQTFNRWRGEGRGPHFIKLGSRVVYDQSDLDAWLAENRRRSTSEYELA
jgi:predicted DNA-binding transcriptional regulator AlpA